MESRYYGPDKVVAVTECDFKTPRGSDVVTVHFEGDVRSETMPKATFERLVTPEPVEPTHLRTVRYQPLIDSLIEVIMEYDVKFSDLAYIGRTLVTRIEDAFERASSYLWTGNDKDWISGVDYRSDLTVLGAERVLRGIKKDDEGTA